MARTFTEREVRELIAEAVAEAVAPLRNHVAELEAEIMRLRAQNCQAEKRLLHIVEATVDGFPSGHRFARQWPEAPRRWRRRMAAPVGSGGAFLLSAPVAAAEACQPASETPP